MMTDTQFSAEDAFTGALLHMPVPIAKEALDLVHDDDVADFLNITIVKLARALVAEGVAPDPMAVSIRARADGIVAGPEAIRMLTLRLADLYADVVTPANWRYYAHGLIDEALRRAFIAMGTRVMQAAEGSALDVMVDLLDAECRLVRRLLDRRAALAGPPAPRLRQVAG